MTTYRCPDCDSTDIRPDGQPFAYCANCYLEGYRTDFK
jgi:hypothetical protein